MLALGEEGLKRHIRTIGLFNTKAKNVIALSRALVEQHGGKVPADRDALQKLPGVGRKTANVVMNVAFGAETFAVDTHVFRVANRTGLRQGQDGRRGRGDPRPADAAALPPHRPPSADPARPLRLQGAQARMLALRGPRPVRLQAEDAAAGGGREMREWRTQQDSNL